MGANPRPGGLPITLGGAALVLAGLVAVASAQGTGPAPAPRAALTLADLERRALAGNPTLSQAEAARRALAGRERQAGIYPNPILGWELEDLNQREPSHHKHFLWFQVPIVTGGKLARSRALAATDSRLGEVGAETQRLRVLTTVRLLYWEALGAARVVDLRRQLAQLTREAVDISEELYNVGQADRPDVLEVEIQANRAELEAARAESHQARVWAQLASAVGDPALPLGPLAGDLEAGPAEQTPDAVVARLLRESPEVKRARLGVERAQAALERVRAERVPNLFVRAKVGYNLEPVASGDRTGFEGGLEIGVLLPLFDRQQGNLAAAEADLEHARLEVRRLELDLRSLLAGALTAYGDARQEVERFRREILPRAQRSFDLYEQGFRQMAAAYPQVLIARRMLYQARVEYVQAQVELWRGAAVLDGFLLAGGLDGPSHSMVQMPPPSGHVPAGSARTAD